MSSPHQKLCLGATNANTFCFTNFILNIIEIPREYIDREIYFGSNNNLIVITYVCVVYNREKQKKNTNKNYYYYKYVQKIGKTENFY